MLAPLLDAAGQPFRDMPCTADPRSWDSDAPINDRRNAAYACRRICPALEACGVRRRLLGSRATGVWAGKVIPTGYPRVLGAEDRETLAHAAAAGVTIRRIHTDKGPE